MNEQNHLPVLITFDGQARSGKGTIVQATKDYLRDERHYKVMLIDAGQVFRVLVVAAMRAGVDLDDETAVDSFLSDEEQSQECARLVKSVYHMTKDERDALLYTNEVGANSAKIGARPLSQEFKDELLRKWMQDARIEGYEVVLLDGRALEETGNMLVGTGLCTHAIGLFFVCDAVMGAMRTLGFASKTYAELTEFERIEVDTLVQQIKVRNAADESRAVQPVVPPESARAWQLPASVPDAAHTRYVVDTSRSMTKQEMSRPVYEFVGNYINGAR